MARIARVIAPGVPHSIVQRGNRRQDVFLKEGEQRAYLDILEEQAEKNRLCIYAYCLMTNPVHIIAVPETETGLTRSIGETHRRYTCMINFRRPLGDTDFVEQLERQLNRTLKPQKRGPKGPWKHKKKKGGKIRIMSPELLASAHAADGAGIRQKRPGP